MFRGMNTGPSVHIASGAGGFISEAFTSVFGGRGPAPGALMLQDSEDCTHAPAAQNGVASDAGHEQQSDFVFAMINGVPVPGPPTCVNRGNSTANPNLNPSPGASTLRYSHPAPLNPGGAPPAAGGDIPADVLANSPTPHNVLPPFANPFGPFSGPQPNPALNPTTREESMNASTTDITPACREEGG